MRRRISRSDPSFRVVGRRAPLAGTSVLLVDDDEDSLDIEAMILAHAGARVLAVSSADEAVGALDDFDPHVIVTDLSMPKRDGFQLCRELRRSRCRGVPFVAVTGFASEADRSRALEAGFSTHVAKPVEPEHLVAVIVEMAGRRRAFVDDGDEPTVQRTKRSSSSGLPRRG